jgi:two-component sensor histidine kinase
MGFRTVYALAEQVGGVVSVEADRGVACRISLSAADSAQRASEHGPEAASASASS